MLTNNIPEGYVKCDHPVHPAIIPEKTCSLRCELARKVDAAKGNKKTRAKCASRIPYDSNCSKCPIGLALIGIKPKPEPEKHTKGNIDMNQKTKETEAPKVPEVPMKKCCGKCGKDLPMTPEYFARNSAYSCGFNNVCKMCKNAEQREKYALKKAAKEAAAKAVPQTPTAEAAEKEIFPETKKMIDSAVERKLCEIAASRPRSSAVKPSTEHRERDRDAALRPAKDWIDPCPPIEPPAKILGIPPMSPPEFADYDMMAESFGRANTTLVLDFSGHEDLLSAICAEAKKDLRLPSMQALWHLTRIPTLQKEA